MARRATVIIPPAVAGRRPSLYASDMAARPIDEEIDKLYQLSLEDFTAARNALAKEAGPAAVEVKALQKPPLAAWAINQVYWRGRPAFHALTASASALRNAHTAVVSGKRWALLHERRDDADRPPDLDDLLRRLSPVDLVLLEGFKSLPMPRIEIRKADDAMPLAGGEGDGPLAIVTDGPAGDDRVPTFRRDDIEAIAAFIAERIRAVG